MKKLTLILIISASIMCTGVLSCKKSSTNTVSPTPTGSSNNSPTPVTGNVDGALISLKVELTSVVGGFPITITTDNGIATFFSSTGNNTSYVDGGTVSVNMTGLDKQSNNAYIKSATTGQVPDNLNFDGGNSNWSVAGAGSVPSIMYNHNVLFPNFTGSIATTIVRANALTIPLSGMVSDADSVIIFIVKDKNSLTRTFAASAASATISAADLAHLPVVSDNTALIEVIPYKITLKSFGGKSYAFVKEHAVIKNINIQ